jgi:hypothetical protein
MRCRFEVGMLKQEGEMREVKITGEAVVRMTQYLYIPDDELRELLDDPENLKCNMDENNCTKEIIEWQFIRGEVVR